MNPEEREAEQLAQDRERIYKFLAAMLSHPDEGKWGRVVCADEQRLAIQAVDRLREQTVSREGGRRSDSLASQTTTSALDLRYIVLELCQPMEHLKAEHERVFCETRLDQEISPLELDHRCIKDPVKKAEFLADLASQYRSFEFDEGNRLPSRPDHISHELEFMGWLISRRRIASRVAHLDPTAAGQSSVCDLAQRSFFGNHLAVWGVTFAKGLQKYTSGGYFEPLGAFLEAWLEREQVVLGPRSRMDEREGANRRQSVAI
jgi:TorA maturation chaperone TorD